MDFDDFEKYDKLSGEDESNHIDNTMFPDQTEMDVFPSS